VLSVVIPTLNAAQCLPAALRSVAAADELFVADGGSTALVHFDGLNDGRMLFPLFGPVRWSRPVGQFSGRVKLGSSCR